MELTRISAYHSFTSSSLRWILQFLLENVNRTHWLAHTLTLDFYQISKMPLEPLRRVQSLKKHLKMTSGDQNAAAGVAKAGFSVSIYTPKMNQLECHWVSSLKSKGAARSLCSLPIILFLSLLCHRVSLSNSRNWLHGMRIYSWEWDHSSPCRGAILYLQTFSALIWW